MVSPIAKAFYKDGINLISIDFNLPHVHVIVLCIVKIEAMVTILNLDIQRCTTDYLVDIYV